MADSGRFGGPHASALVLILFAIVFVALTTVSYTQKSAVWDEPIHLADGFVSVAAHDFRVDVEHPPFLRMWAALPLLGIGVTPFDTTVIDAADPVAWARSPFQAASRFLYQHNDADRLLYAARFMIVLLGVALGIVLFLWAREWLGFWPAVAALVLYTLEPNILAHASLVTTDLGFTCFMFASLYFLWRTIRGAAAINVAGLVGCFALAVVSKFSAVVLAPIVVLLIAIAAVRRRLTWGAAAGIVALMIVTSWMAIWAMYGFRYAPGPSPNWVFAFQHDAYVQQQHPTLARAIGFIDGLHVLPNAFTQGFLFGQVKASRPVFFAGEYNTSGWWSYFPFAIAIKTPIAMLLLAIAGLAIAITRRRALEPFSVLCVVAPIVLFLGASMTSPLNIGVRHVLPIYPLLLLLAAVAAKSALDARASAPRIALAVMVAGGAIETLHVYPDNLAFFNAFAGGPAGGSRYLTDSNLDWGQDLKPLKRWMDAQKVTHINLAYFGTAAPAYYGIAHTLMPGSTNYAGGGGVQLPGYVAVSRTVLNGVYLGPRERAFWAPLKLRTPVTSIGQSINVYWVEGPWWQ